MSAKKQPKINSSSNGPLMIEDPYLEGKYSVLEIATLAAGCTGDSSVDRILAAMDLLIAAENVARGGSKELLRLRNLKHSGRVEPAAIENEHNYLEYLRENTAEAQRICETAKRDEKTGRIERTSLVGLIYASAGIGNADSPEANRKYNEWLRVGDIPGPSPWPSQNERRQELFADKEKTAAAAKLLKARF